MLQDLALIKACQCVSVLAVERLCCDQLIGHDWPTADTWAYVAALPELEGAVRAAERAADSARASVERARKAGGR